MPLFNKQNIYARAHMLQTNPLRTKQNNFFALLTVFFLFINFNALGDESTKASIVVSDFQSTLIKVMKVANNNKVAERYKLLQPSVDRSFHLALMTQISASSFWRIATSDEKTQLIKGFRRMSVATLATLFSGYNGEKFYIIGEKPGPYNTTVVYSDLVKSDKSKVSIAYVTKFLKDKWKIIDIILDGGISELKVRRSEYRNILKKSGVRALINLLNSKADQLMSE